MGTATHGLSVARLKPIVLSCSSGDTDPWRQSFNADFGQVSWRCEQIISSPFHLGHGGGPWMPQSSSSASADAIQALVTRSKKSFGVSYTEIGVSFCFYQLQIYTFPQRNSKSQKTSPNNSYQPQKRMDTSNNDQYNQSLQFRADITSSTPKQSNNNPHKEPRILATATIMTSTPKRSNHGHTRTNK